jgi:holo-[acyl-carrier protein] synthase
MILGMGNDLTDARRVEKSLARFGAHFTRRCFTEDETAFCENRRGPGGRAAAYAKRFAAKEACAKALGTGFGDGVAMRDISVSRDERGKPGLKLSGGALERLERMTPEGSRAVLHLSLTDEPPLACAHVIIEAVSVPHFSQG